MRDIRNWIIAALLAALPLAVLGGVLAQQQRVTTTVDGRVWQSVANSDRFYVSIRADGGSWADAGAIPVSLDGLSGSGSHRYGDFSATLALPAPSAPAPAATPDASATAEPSASAAPDAAPRDAESALANARAAYRAAWDRAYAVYDRTWRAAIAAHRARAAELWDDRDAVAASYAEYQREEMAAAAALTAAVAPAGEALNAAMAARSAADAAQSDE